MLVPNRNLWIHNAYTLGSPPSTLSCPYCSRHFHSKGGRTQHIWAKHHIGGHEPHGSDPPLRHHLLPPHCTHLLLNWTTKRLWAPFHLNLPHLLHMKMSILWTLILILMLNNLLIWIQPSLTYMVTKWMKICHLARIPWNNGLILCILHILCIAITPRLMVSWVLLRGYQHLWWLFLGKICDENGNDLPPDTPPPPHDSDLGPDNWTPYDNRLQFEVADFLFHWNHMSTRDINYMLNLWAVDESQTIVDV